MTIASATIIPICQNPVPTWSTSRSPRRTPIATPAVTSATRRSRCPYDVPSDTTAAIGANTGSGCPSTSAASSQARPAAIAHCPICQPRCRSRTTRSRTEARPRSRATSIGVPSTNPASHQPVPGRAQVDRKPDVRGRAEGQGMTTDTPPPPSPPPRTVAADTFTLPCQTTEADWFAEHGHVLQRAKEACGPCPLREACLRAALDRREPWGVWGGEIFVDGVVVASQARPRPPPQAPGAA